MRHQKNRPPEALAKGGRFLVEGLSGWRGNGWRELDVWFERACIPMGSDGAFDFLDERCAVGDVDASAMDLLPVFWKEKIKGCVMLCEPLPSLITVSKCEWCLVAITEHVIALNRCDLKMNDACHEILVVWTWKCPPPGRQ